MGDRAQIAIKQRTGSNGKVYLYSHWDGRGVLDRLRTALRRRQRWDDPEYLTRIIFCELVRGKEAEETGYGIGTRSHGDIEHPIPVLDCAARRISWEPSSFGDEVPADCSFEEFCAQE